VEPELGLSLNEVDLRANPSRAFSEVVRDDGWFLKE